jgi:hypothetical protein
MKLKCDKHARRVLSIPGSPALHHRTGDMSKCDGKTAVMVDNTSHITRSFHIVLGKLVQFECNKESRPHTNRKKE